MQYFYISCNLFHLPQSTDVWYWLSLRGIPSFEIRWRCTDSTRQNNGLFSTKGINFHLHVVNMKIFSSLFLFSIMVMTCFFTELQCWLPVKCKATSRYPGTCFFGSQQTISSNCEFTVTALGYSWNEGIIIFDAEICIFIA